MIQLIRPISRPSVNHERRKAILHTIAVLSGYHADVPVPLPDGSIPDVFKASLFGKGFFLGEAKDSEEPTNSATCHRLMRYSLWIPRAGLPHHSVLAVCAGERGGAEWSTLLTALAMKRGLSVINEGHKDVEEGTYIYWVAVRQT